MSSVNEIVHRVEDDAAARKALRRLLACQGLPVETDAQREDILASLPVHSQTPDVEPVAAGDERLRGAGRFSSRPITVPIVTLNGH